MNGGKSGIAIRRTKDASSLGARIGRVRWTICAMLFVATSINYMDRQVLAILKPTLMKPAARHRHDRSGLRPHHGRFHGRLCAGPAGSPDASLTRSARASATWSSWPSGAFRPWATRWPIPCWSSASRASAWAWANPATFPPPSRPWPSGFRRASARWPPASSTPAPMSAPSWLPSSCPG